MYCLLYEYLMLSIIVLLYNCPPLEKQILTLTLILLSTSFEKLKRGTVDTFLKNIEPNLLGKTYEANKAVVKRNNYTFSLDKLDMADFINKTNSRYRFFFCDWRVQYLWRGNTIKKRPEFTETTLLEKL